MLEFAIRKFQEEGITYEKLVSLSLQADPILKEKLICDFLGITQNTNNNGCDGYDFNRGKMVEIKTQKYSGSTSGSNTKLNGTMTYSSPSLAIYEKKLQSNEDTYYAGFIGTKLAVIIRTSFVAIAEDFKKSLENPNLKIYNPSYGVYINHPDTEIIYKSPDILELREYFSDPFYDILVGITPEIKMREKVNKVFNGEYILVPEEGNLYTTNDKVKLLHHSGDEKTMSVTSLNAKYNKKLKKGE